MRIGLRLAAGCALSLAFASGCGRESASRSALSRIVYVDVKTGRPVLADAAPNVPAVNPATGKRTLMPALYCAQCREWRAVPPVGEVQRNPQARKCPKCREDLRPEGPLPPAAE